MVLGRAEVSSVNLNRMDPFESSFYSSLAGFLNLFIYFW